MGVGTTARREVQKRTWHMAQTSKPVCRYYYSALSHYRPSTSTNTAILGVEYSRHSSQRARPRRCPASCGFDFHENSGFSATRTVATHVDTCVRGPLPSPFLSETKSTAAPPAGVLKSRPFYFLRQAGSTPPALLPLGSTPPHCCRSRQEHVFFLSFSDTEVRRAARLFAAASVLLFSETG